MPARRCSPPGVSRRSARASRWLPPRSIPDAPLRSSPRPRRSAHDAHRPGPAPGRVARAVAPRRPHPADARAAPRGGRTAPGAATALSVLTEPTRFGGSDEDLRVASGIGLPVLRKDFTVNRYQVFQARVLGADAVLLIVRALTDDRLRELLDAAGA